MNKNIHSVSTFQTEWFTKKKASKSSGARRTLCQKDIDVSAMGNSSLDSHAKDKKYKERVQERS